MTNFVPPSSSIPFPELPEGVLKSGYEAETTLSLVNPKDIGVVAALVFENPEDERWEGKEVEVVGESLSVKETIEILGEVRGRKAEMQVLVEGEAEGFRELMRQGQVFVNSLFKAGFRADFGVLPRLGVEVTTWRSFLEERKSKGLAF